MTQHAMSVMQRVRGFLALTGVLLAGVAPAWADGDQKQQLHGFASQGYALSDGNNFIDDSLDGSFDFYELGLNGSVAKGPVTVSAQGVMRRYGTIDSGRARMDYAFVDYRVLSDFSYNAGIRLGRFRNQYGFFNDTQDVVFTRPGVVLPISVYFAGAGVRGLLFSSDGAQLYGGTDIGDHYLSLSASRALANDADSDQERALFGSKTLFGRVRIKSLNMARVMDDWASGAWQFGFSWVSTDLKAEPAPNSTLQGTVAFDIYVLSLRHNAERYSITTEYAVTQATGYNSRLGHFERANDGLYVQGDYRFNPRWSGMLRYDLSWLDRTDRDGHRYADATGGDPHSRYARELVTGVKWLPDRHWGVWTEFHLFQGSSTVPAYENRGRSIETNSNLLLLMVGYHF